MIVELVQLGVHWTFGSGRSCAACDAHRCRVGLEQASLIMGLFKEQDGHVGSVAREYVPHGVQLGHRLQRDGEHVESDSSSAVRAVVVDAKKSLHRRSVLSQIGAHAIVHIPEKEAEQVVDETRQIQSFGQLQISNEPYILKHDQEDHQRVDDLMKDRIFPYEQVDIGERETVGDDEEEDERALLEKSLRKRVGRSFKQQLFSGQNEVIVGVDEQTRAEHHGQLVEQLILVDESHVKHPGADADEYEAQIAQYDGARDAEADVVVARQTRVRVGPVDAVEGKEYHDQIAHRVPELGNVMGNLVVDLAPVNGGRLLAPESVYVLWISYSIHLFSFLGFIKKTIFLY